MPVLKDLEVLSWRELVPELATVIDMADYAGLFVVVLIFVAAVAGVANTLMMATFERMHEFGMLLALGSRPWRLVKLILAEAALLGIVGVVVGTALGVGFVGITSVTGIDMASWGGEHVQDLAYGGLMMPVQDIYPRLQAVDVLVGLGAVIFTSLVAAAWPATVAARLEPMEAMRA
jgi:ABC-type lipoprotein release transport system permease subunit